MGTENRPLKRVNSTKRRDRHLISIVTIGLVWAHSVYLGFDQAFRQDFTSSVPQFALYAGGYGLLSVMLVWGLLRIEGERFSDLGLETDRFGAQLGIGVLFGLGLFILHQAVLNPLADVVISPTASSGVDLAPLLSNPVYYPVWIGLALFKGGFEEEVWRVFALTRFEKRWGVSGLLFAIVVGSLVFGAGHFYQGADAVFTSSIKAALYSLIYLRKRRAMEAMVAHAVYDIIGVTLFYLL